MGALGASSITYVVNNQRRGGNSKVQNRVTLTFGDGSSTYPSGGISLTSGNMGCPNTLESVSVVDKGSSGYSFNYNSSTGKLQMYQGQLHNHQILLKDAAQADGATTRVNAAAANKLGAGTGSDIIIAGVTSTTAAAGGVVSAQSSGSYSEIAASVAPASLSLIVEVIGW